ncbi:hypothetical protein KC367_g118 [Hortaea werneckii]|nr:hypothetical protein KC367_g118 [Hortaea werneckii]
MSEWCPHTNYSKESLDSSHPLPRQDPSPRSVDHSNRTSRPQYSDGSSPPPPRKPSRHYPRSSRSSRRTPARHSPDTTPRPLRG